MRKNALVVLILAGFLTLGPVFLTACASESSAFVGSWKTVSDVNDFQVMQFESNDSYNFGFKFEEDGSASLLISGLNSNIALATDPFMKYTAADGVFELTTTDGDQIVFSGSGIPFVGNYSFEGQQLKVELVDGSVIGLEKIS